VGGGEKRGRSSCKGKSREEKIVYAESCPLRHSRKSTLQLRILWKGVGEEFLENGPKERKTSLWGHSGDRFLSVNGNNRVREPDGVKEDHREPATGGQQRKIKGTG